MKENAILIRPLDVLKVEVDFSNLENINYAINADGVSTIHTQKTQEISDKLGIHIIGFVDRNANDINNPKACEISGYKYIGSFMLVCKTDSRFNPLPLNEDELETVYTYLATNDVALAKSNDAKTFFTRYEITNPLLPVSNVVPSTYYKKEVPYLIMFRYDLTNLSRQEIDEFAESLKRLDKRIFFENFRDVDGVLMSSDKKYYFCSLLDDDLNNFYVVLQAKDDVTEEILLKNIKGTVNGFLGLIEEPEHVDMDTASEETMD